MPEVRQARKSHWLVEITAMVGWPLLFGAASSSVFYAALFRGPLNLPILHRYFASHPILVVETVLFFMGLAALVLKFMEVFQQSWWLAKPLLDRPPAEGEEPSRASHWLEVLQKTAPVGRSWLATRLFEALQYVARTGSADHLEDELKYLAEQDEQRQYDSYALVRIVVWAIPMLGFLGTVMGIAQALGNLDPQQLATAPAQAMQGLLAGLYVAFDTTALALSLSLSLMFLQFPIDRVEVHLLGQVKQRATELLVGRFRTLGGNLDPHLASVERMCYAVIRAMENLVQRQVELWAESLAYVRAEWQQNWQQAGQSLRTALAESLDEVLATHTQRLAQIEVQAQEQAAQRWQQGAEAWQRTMSTLQEQLHAIQQQTAVWQRIVEATGDVLRLEQALNDNLQQLAGAKHFEETVMSLAAAIQLLTARLYPGGDIKRVELRPATVPQERAA